MKYEATFLPYKNHRTTFVLLVYLGVDDSQVIHVVFVYEWLKSFELLIHVKLRMMFAINVN